MTIDDNDAASSIYGHSENDMRPDRLELARRYVSENLSAAEQRELERTGMANSAGQGRIFADAQEQNDRLAAIAKREGRPAPTTGRFIYPTGRRIYERDNTESSLTKRNK